jgi:hypothetical protein
VLERLGDRPGDLRRDSGPVSVAHTPGWWVMMSALEPPQGAGFTRTRLMDRGLLNWVRRAIVLAVLAGVGMLVWKELRPAAGCAVRG